jgi:GGDEF domain-containing protein
MESIETKTLIRLGHPRFRNFSDAVEPMLSAIADAIPGLIVLGRLEPDEQGCRVIEVQGAGVDGIKKGNFLPLDTHTDNGGPRPDDEDPWSSLKLDSDYLELLGARAKLEIPLEVSDGRIVGILCAFDSRADVYGSTQGAMLGVAARLLGHEWESVEHRAELRRLRKSCFQGSKVDQDTDLPNRDSFLELLDHEWKLTNRGTVESVLVAFRVGADPDQPPNGDARSKLAMKIVAEVLQANARTTDRLGRVGEATVATILVGCRAEHAHVFVDRVQAALRRVTDGRGPRIQLSNGIQVLAEAPSPEEAFMLAEATARAAGQDHPAHAAQLGVRG